MSGTDHLTPLTDLRDYGDSLARCRETLDPGVVQLTLHADGSLRLRGVATSSVLEALEVAGIEVVIDARQLNKLQRACLTEREIAIVRLIAAGSGNGEIADQLYLSVNTVKSYIRTAYRKMGVRTRSQAVRWFVETGA